VALTAVTRHDACQWPTTETSRKVLGACVVQTASEYFTVF